MFCHALYLKFSLDPAYVPSDNWAKIFPGHSCVLLFFVLSGYVIGLTNQRPLNRITTGRYLKNRLIRLYPIYVLSLILTLFIAFPLYPLRIILGHFVFLQNSIVPVMYENNPLWSLNSEIVYYLLFIPISFLGLSPGKVCFTALFVGVVSAAVLHNPMFSSYSFGFVFWAAGLWLSQRQTFETQNSSKYLLFSLLFLFIGYQQLNPFIPVFAIVEGKMQISNSNPSGPMVVFNDLAQLPFCLYIFIKFTNKKVPKDVFFITGLVSLGLLYFSYSFYKHGLNSLVVYYKILPVIFFSVGAILLVVSYCLPKPTSPQLMPKFILKLGAISYAVYVVHFPISLILSKISMFSGSLLTFILRMVVDLILVLLISNVLELKIQPWFKARFAVKAIPAIVQ